MSQMREAVSCLILTMVPVVLITSMVILAISLVEGTK